jgi:chorismate--pyruvate lyase
MGMNLQRRYSYQTDMIITNNHPRYLVNNVSGWLYKTYVLTKALRETYDHVRVHVIDQQKDNLLEFEKLIINDSEGYVRQVFLLGDETPQVYARVAVPNPVYLKYESEFLNLGDKPIGETMLYNRPDIKRGKFTYKQIKISDLPFYDTKYADKELTPEHRKLMNMKIWTRSSIFYKDNAVFAIVSETIFPTIRKILGDS